MIIEYMGNTGFRKGHEVNAYLVGMEEGMEFLRNKAKIVLIGAGEDGYVAKVLLHRNGIKIWKYADNNSKIVGRKVDDTIVQSLEDLFNEPDVYFVISVSNGNIGGVRLQLLAHRINNYSVIFRVASHCFANEDMTVHDLFMQGINKICFEGETVESALPQAGYSSGKDGGSLGNINWLLKSSEWSHFGFGWLMDKLECNRNIKILEIGPGYGLMSYVIMKLYPNASMHWVLLGTEQRPLASIGYERGLKKVKDEFSDRITYTFGRIELDDDLLCEKYDVVIMTEVFEHFAIRPVETMQKLRTALKPDGMMFLTTPNWGHLPTFTSWEKLVTKDEITEERYNELLQCGHVYQYNKVEMDDILNRAGWRVEEYAVSDGNNHNYLLKSQG